MKVVRNPFIHKVEDVPEAIQEVRIFVLSLGILLNVRIYVPFPLNICFVFFVFLCGNIVITS